jgi:Leucine-rich repeat (LRR) protein
MVNFIRGLNLSRNLSDVFDLDNAIENLGLNPVDIDVIRGINDTISKEEIRLLANLTSDQKKEFHRLNLSSKTINNDIQNIPSILFPNKFNVSINAKLIAGSVKYSYIDYAANNEIKTADISTSRVTSWSSFETPVTSTSPIFYGGDLEVIGNNINASEIRVVNAPIAKQYAAEQATHLIEINVNGTPKQFYAMKGIPLVFEAFFRNAVLGYDVTGSSVTPTWVIKNTGTSQKYESTSDIYNFFDSTSKQRTVEFYYNPANIVELSLPNINLIELPKVTLPAITSLDVSFNQLSEMPQFNQLTPTLETLILNGNNLSNSNDTANTQLQNLPTTLTYLDVSSCFTDNGDIDISYLDNLQTFIMTGNSVTVSRRIGGLKETTSPKVSANTIQNYNVANQSAYKFLDNSISESDTLRTLNIVGTRIQSLANNDPITLSSNDIRTVYSSQNNHNVIDVSNKTLLTVYSQKETVGILQEDNDVGGKFTGCNSLQSIDFYATPVTGDVGTDFQNLPSLLRLDLRGTRIGGRLGSDAFSGTTNLQRFYFSSYGSIDSSNTFFESDVFTNTTDLIDMFVYNNTNINGSLPSFTTNNILSRVAVWGTSLSGNLPSFSNANNPNLRTLVLAISNFSGAIPDYELQNVGYIDFRNNQLTGSPTFDCPNLINLRLENNQLSGQVIDMSSCTNIRNVYLQNNSFNDYFTGALSSNRINILDLSNNNLPLSAATAFFEDLLASYELSPRSSVTINLLGNSSFTETSIRSLTPSTAANILDFLRGKNWTILLNA